MSDKRIFRLVHAEARSLASRYCLDAPDGWIVKFSEASRSLDQNSAQWPILQAFSEQLLWPVNGEKVKMSPEEWKDVLTAAFRQERPRLAMGLDGGVVMLGQRTSKFGKKEFSDWLEFLHAAAAQRGIIIYGQQSRESAP